MNIDKVKAAIEYALHRIQTNPDMHFVAGPGTETFHLLCEAEAELTGTTLASVERRCAVDRQPAYSWRRPEMERLREERDLLRAAAMPDDLDRINGEVLAADAAAEAAAMRRRAEEATTFDEHMERSGLPIVPDAPIATDAGTAPRRVVVAHGFWIHPCADQDNGRWAVTAPACGYAVVSGIFYFSGAVRIAAALPAALVTVQPTDHLSTFGDPVAALIATRHDP